MEREIRMKLAKINMNKVAREISMIEGKKAEVNIAQIKEVCHCFLLVLAKDYQPSQIVELVARYFKKTI